MGLLTGRKAVVTGVANKWSIAWGITQAFQAEGAEMALLCLESNVRRVRRLAGDIAGERIIPFDAADDASIARAFQEVARVFDGTLDILVHCIAYADMDDLGGEFIKVSNAGWDKALRISAYSLVAFCREARPLLRAAGGGSVMTLTFAGGEKVVPGYNVMGLAKAALNMSMRYLAYDLGPDRIRVNAISAGPIPTLSSKVIEHFDRALKLTREHAPLLRNIAGEDVGATAVYLASDLSRNVTGSVLKVDAGMDILCPPSEPHGTLEPTAGSES